MKYSMIDWNIVGFVKASDYRTSILKSLGKKQKSPSELRGDLGFYISHISKTLKELIGRGLVICLTNEVKKGKIFAITEAGRQVLAQLIE